MISETSRCRERLFPYCQGMGLDIGFGGDPITKTSINLDLPRKYTLVGDSVQHLYGDAINLYWFRDGVLDYVYSSHLLEDFPQHEVTFILDEWIRVLKPGGFLVLYLPDISVYNKYCKQRNEPINPHHKNLHMNLKWLGGMISSRNDVEIVYSRNGVGDYSFEIVARKKQ